jgi:hypothetical protein
VIHAAAFTSGVEVVARWVGPKGRVSCSANQRRGAAVDSEALAASVLRLLLDAQTFVLDLFSAFISYLPLVVKTAV